MTKKLVGIVAVLLVVAAGIYGARYKKTYIDFINSPEFEDEIYVAQMNDIFVDGICERSRILFPQQPYILRIEPLEEVMHEYMADSIKVVVKEVFKGEEINLGDELLLAGEGWYTSVLGDPRSFENFFCANMSPGKDYLVFLTHKKTNLYGEEFYNISMRSNMVSMAGIFCYDNLENIVSENRYPYSTYVPFKDVKNNEFYADTEEVLIKLENFKNEMISMYPIGSGKW